MNASEIMTENPVAIRVDGTAAEAADILASLEVRHLPVVEDGKLVGIISDRDLRGLHVLHRAVEEGQEDVDAGAVWNPDAAIGTLMAADVVRCDPETSVSELVDLILEHKVGAVPVVSPDNGDLLGIVSYVDVLRAVRDVM